MEEAGALVPLDEAHATVAHLRMVGSLLLPHGRGLDGESLAVCVEREAVNVEDEAVVRDARDFVCHGGRQPRETDPGKALPVGDRRQDWRRTLKRAGAGDTGRREARETGVGGYVADLHSF